ncbi:MAG: BREX system serine/threonine kinase PglW [Mycobacteriales bacterium]
MDGSRWVEVTASPFPHEAEGLAQVKAMLPMAPPFRAWSNVEFRDSSGRWSEVDLLVLGRRRLHLVEMKYYSGVLRGNDLTWQRDGRPAEDSPLKLARRKAQRLASRLRDEAERYARETRQPVGAVRDALPYVQESVYLHHPTFRSGLPMASQADLFGLRGDTARIGLDGIDERLLESGRPGQQVDVRTEEVVVALLSRIGLVQRRQREVGSWIIDDEPMGDGDGYQDWPAHHRVATTDRRRIRFFLTPPGAGADQARITKAVAEHEYRILSRLHAEGLLRPLDLVEHELGVGLVFPYDERLRRLDLWLSDRADALSTERRLDVVQQVAETLAYAHRHRVVHRGLQPSAVAVREVDGTMLRVVVGDWQSSGMVPGGSSVAGSSVAGVTGLAGSEAAQRLAGVLGAGADDARRLAQAYAAPESTGAAADRVRLDVFALGALTYYLVSGRHPAADRLALRDRLTAEGGLDLAADMSQVPSALRALVLQATRPVVSERLADVRAFLELLDGVRAQLAGTDEIVDPLEAVPGGLLDGRWEVQRRLGKGSTALALLVRDTTGGDGDQPVVLKCALDDAAAARLDDEAAVLATLDHPRLVRLLDGPVDVGGRRALVLTSAGESTLAEALQARAGRLSLDRLERWGRELLEAMSALERLGLSHRDVKPANLGLLEGRGDRQAHLVLFDFSLARARADALTAGTAPYLDPFLGTGARTQYDSAAERYAAAVVLFEMATGAPPAFGDGQSDPAMVREEATVHEGLFDPVLAPRLVPFFRTALARNAAARHGTAGDMRAAWAAVFDTTDTGAPDDAGALAAAAVPGTPLVEAGLSARALSAVEPLKVVTAGDLAAIDPVRLSRLAGVAEATRKELRERARLWREAFAAPAEDVSVSEVERALDLLLRAVPEGQRATAAAVLGHGTEADVDAFAPAGRVAAALGRKRVRVTADLVAARAAWRADADAAALLERVRAAVDDALGEVGVVATATALAAAAGAVGGSVAPVEADRRRLRGLLAAALDPVATDALALRRRGDDVVLFGREPALLDAIGAAGAALDEALAASGPDVLLGASRVGDLAGLTAPVLQPLDDAAVVPLVVAAAVGARLSGRGEVHRADLPSAAALRLALDGLSQAEPLAAGEVRERVRARFPSLPPLPGRPQLDVLLEEAGLALVYDEARTAYRARALPTDTTGFRSRVPTRHLSPEAARLLATGELGVRLEESLRTRSFLALAVGARDLDRAQRALAQRFEARTVDVTGVLLDAVERTAASFPIAWEQVVAADAAAPGTTAAQGLAKLVADALPEVRAAVEAALAESAATGAPVVLTELGALARYGALGMLSTWTDLAARRPSAVWALLPQLGADLGAVVDGRPVPLAAPGQLLRLDSDWLVAVTDDVPT